MLSTTPVRAPERRDARQVLLARIEVEGRLRAEVGDDVADVHAAPVLGGRGRVEDDPDDPLGFRIGHAASAGAVPCAAKNSRYARGPRASAAYACGDIRCSAARSTAPAA